MSGDSETNCTTKAIEKFMRQMDLIGLVEDKMFQDPGIDLTTKPIVEQMRQMTRNRPAHPIGNNSEIDGECGDNCPFLTLPNELIIDIFSLLSKKDRMRARLNKRLNDIEAESKYYAKRLMIAGAHHYTLDGSLRKERFNDYTGYGKENSQHVFHFEEMSDSSKFIKRICQNMSMKFLVIHNEEVLEGVLTDSIFLDIPKACKHLDICQFDSVSAEALHQVYKNMTEGSTKLRSLYSRYIKLDLCIAFLSMIGIRHQGYASFFSDRDIEAFTLIEQGNYFCDYHFFDGNLEIVVSDETYSGSEKDFIDKGKLILRLHETPESLNEAKGNPNFQTIDLSE